MSSTPTVAFFGATGGCANACLVHTIRAGLQAVALVRTPQKLKDQLLAQGLDEDLIDSKLAITQGNALDVAAVKKTLLATTNSGSGVLPSVIVTGLGGAPRMEFKLSPLQFFTLDDPSICANAAETLCTALSEIYAEFPQAAAARKPYLAFVSTTGITRGPEDVPFLMRFLYHQVLAIPHVDKKRMEDTYRGSVEQTDAEKRLFSGFTGIRPTLLTGAVSADDGVGLEKLRVGTEQKPALGYTVKRADVGHWIFENVVGNEEKRRQWTDQMVSITS